VPVGSEPTEIQRQAFRWMALMGLPAMAVALVVAAVAGRVAGSGVVAMAVMAIDVAELTVLLPGAARRRYPEAFPPG
jgi:hypothetical protein